MSFFLAAAAFCASGYALLWLLRLATGRLAVDLAASWFVGTGFYSLAVFVLRFLFGVPYTALSALAVLALPPAALAGAWASGRRSPGAAPPGSVAPPSPARLVPRPVWLFAPLAAYVLFTAAVTVLHGVNTPTQTDDALRVRALAPVLAFRDEWNAEARGVLVMSGPIPTFVPSLGWRLTGSVDQFHVNGSILLGLVALLLLSVALPSARGSPERGWASAFAVLSLPLFVYHCTATYADATLAIYLGAAFLFFIEFGLGADEADGKRAMLLLVGAAMVKREGEITAGAVAAVLLAQAAWQGRRSGEALLRRLLLLCLPLVPVLVARVFLVGWRSAFPFLSVAAQRAVEAAPQVQSAPALAVQARVVPAFVWSVFSSGSGGIVYWVLAAVLALQLGAVRRRGAAWTLAAVLLLFAEVAVTSLWLFPAFTVDQSTVNRQMLPLAVATALWLAALLAPGAPLPVAGAISARAGPAEPGEKRRREGKRRRP